METRDIAQGLKYAPVQELQGLQALIAEVVWDRLQKAETLPDRAEVVAGVIGEIALPSHECGGPVFGRLSDDCAGCAQLRAGRPARRGWSRLSGWFGWCASCGGGGVLALPDWQSE